MLLNYTIRDVDTGDSRCVAFAIIRLFHEAWPEGNSFYIPRLINDVKDMFAGRFENLKAIDTHYHDLEHSLQAALCLTRLLVQRNLSGASLQLSEDDFKLALVAILLHDTGYLKTASDGDGTGAKYTRIHEQRSCQYTAQYLQQFDWEPDRIEAVQHMIRCTGPFADITNVPFARPIDRLLGQTVCTADYIGQMSDPHYVGKLYHLFQEFEESDNYNGVPKKQRAFSSFEELLTKTPDFWEKIVQPRLFVECDNLWKFLKTAHGTNPYIESIEENIEEVRRINANPSRGKWKEAKAAS